jgi:hypothetical protein
VGDGKREGDGLMGFRHACSLCNNHDEINKR